MDKGYFYISGRDRQFRPIIVFDMKQIDMKNADNNLRTIVFIQEIAIDYMFIPGQV